MTPAPVPIDPRSLCHTIYHTSKDVAVPTYFGVPDTTWGSWYLKDSQYILFKYTHEFQEAWKKLCHRY